MAAKKSFKGNAPTTDNIAELAKTNPTAALIGIGQAAELPPDLGIDTRPDKRISLIIPAYQWEWIDAKMCAEHKHKVNAFFIELIDRLIEDEEKTDKE